MGLDNHAGMSPAHRRNQNPLSPSATLFRRSSTFSREELDQSWMALFRRHRFLLLTLALLAFLCTVYLYFAIKLGADSCSGLSANEEARCRLKKSNVKTSRGQRATRVLLSVQESMLEPWSQNHAEVVKEKNVAAWMDFLTKEKSVQSVLSLGCSGSDLTHLLLNRVLVSLPAIGCKEGSLLKERLSELPPNLLQMEVPDSSWLFDLIICESCSLIELTTDESTFSKIDRLLRHKGFFLWISEALTVSKSSDAILSLDNVQLHGWACLSRINDMVLWQKV